MGGKKADGTPILLTKREFPASISYKNITLFGIRTPRWNQSNSDTVQTGNFYPEVFCVAWYRPYKQ